MTQTNILNSADYADALLTAKRAKNLVFLIIMLLLLGELALFVIARYTVVLDAGAPGAAAPRWHEVVKYLVGLIDFLGLILPALLAIVLFLILNVLLLGRLLGAGQLTSAFLLCVLLVLMLFPWQSFLNNPTMNGDPAANAMGLKIPGVLYTWAELTHEQLGAKFTHTDMPFAVLRWARFAAFPGLSILILLMIQSRSNRGLRQALGNDVIMTQTTAA